MPLPKVNSLIFQRGRGEDFGGYLVSSAVTKIVVGKVHRSRTIPGGWVAHTVEGKEIDEVFSTRQEAGLAAFDNYCKFAS